VEGYNSAAPVRYLSPASEAVTILPSLVIMPHSSLNFGGTDDILLSQMDLVAARMADRGIQLLPSWKEAKCFLLKAGLTGSLQEQLPAPRAGDPLPEVCVVPTVVVYPSGTERHRTALSQVRCTWCVCAAGVILYI
jgi:hypothetical protein